MITECHLDILSSFFPRFQVQSSLVLTYSVLGAAWRRHSTEAADLAPLKLWSGSCAESYLVAHSPKGKTENLFLFRLISTHLPWGKPVLKSYFCSLTVSQESEHHPLPVKHRTYHGALLVREVDTDGAASLWVGHFAVIWGATLAGIARDHGWGKARALELSVFHAEAVAQGLQCSLEMLH